MNLKLFLKSNKEEVKNKRIQATKKLKDENGEPLFWEFKKLKTTEYNDIIQKSYIQRTIGKQVKNEFLFSKFSKLLVAESVVCPNLYDVELLDSYGVNKPEDLIVEMIDDPDEFNAVVDMLQNWNNTEDLEELIETAKN